MSERLIASLAVMFCAYALSSCLVPPVRKLALAFGVIDRPGERKSHSTPVPRLGGLAIFLSLVSVVWGSLYWLPQLQSSWLASHFPNSFTLLSSYVIIRPKLWALAAGATIIVAVGVLDDIRGVGFSPYLKLASQTAAALILPIGGIYMDLFSWSPVLAMVGSVVWIVGITNSFNLLDNMDGLSSGIALICSFMFLVLVMLRGEFFIALLLSAMIGSTLGFYQFNMRRGFIFMGDSGSLLLGFLLGAVSLMARYIEPQDASLFPVISPVIILGLPLFDTVSVVVIRLREGRPVFQGDQMHLSHRLVRLGMTFRQAVFFHYLMAFTIGCSALLIINSRLLHSFIAVVQVLSLIAMVTVLMSTRVRAVTGVTVAKDSGTPREEDSKGHQPAA
jgi:UDP-GlcNAc:undecaprenyl-phosphate/decaprenyl-phosphate GlcNAc-1-phosphate transferase